MALDADEIVDIDYIHRTRRVGAAVGYGQLRMRLAGYGNRTHRLFVQKILHLVAEFQLEALHIVVFLLAVVVAERIYPAGTVTLDAYGLVGEVLPKIESRDVILVLRGPHHDAVVALKFAQRSTAAVGIEPSHILVEEYVLAAERRGALLFENDLVYAVTREQIALTLAPLDCERRKVEIGNDAFEPRARLEIYLQHLGLAVGVDRHIEYLAAGRALRQVVLAVARDALYGATLHHYRAVLAVAVEDIVYRAVVVALEDPYIIYALVEEGLFADLRNLVAAVAKDDYNVVEIRAVADQLRILHALAVAEETLLAVDIQTRIGRGHLPRLDSVELADLGTAFAAGSVLGPDTFVILDRIVGKVCQRILCRGDIGLDLLDLVIGLLRVVTRYTNEFQLCKPLHILYRNLAAQRLLERCKPLVDSLVCRLARAAALDELV